MEKTEILLSLTDAELKHLQGVTEYEANRVVNLMKKGEEE